MEYIFTEINPYTVCKAKTQFFMGNREKIVIQLIQMYGGKQMYGGHMDIWGRVQMYGGHMDI